MKARVMSSLALPAALATAGLLSTAEAAYAAAAGSEPLTASARYTYQGQSIDGDVTLTSADGNPCTPMGNVTITDYGHCCTPLANMTITDYAHCCTSVSNVIVCDYGHHQDHHDDHGHHQVHDHDHDHDHDHGYGPGRRLGVG